MGKLSKFIGALSLVILFAAASHAAVNAPHDTAAPAPESKAPDQATPVKTTILPHRAIYDMRLLSLKNGSNISSVTGRMLFEWRDTCDGWAVQQHLRLHFSYNEGDESEVSSTEVTWESKDGKNYNFNIRRVTDGKESDVFRGKAVMKEDGGLVTYAAPEGKTLKLAAGTIFPSAHTHMILQRAATGEKLFSRRVFDGSDEEGSNDVSVFINAASAHLQEMDLGAKLKSNPLLNLTTWPIRMAFFKTAAETSEPDYEMNLNLEANGIAKSMQIDYGDFSVSGTLSDVEAIPSGC